MSKTRKRYLWRLAARIFILFACAALLYFQPEEFSVLEGMNFFHRFSPLHLLWAVWVCDMILQIIPIKNKVPLGSQKLFVNRFRPIRERINHEALRSYVISTTKAAYKVFILWCALILMLGVLFYTGVLSRAGLFMISVFFYVCDLICVLIWCPFRLMMHTRCCTTCRIFNWDHLMMFAHLIFIPGFFTRSLALFAAAVWVIWEGSVRLHPERFWAGSNAALTCASCTDKLCTQYCQKLRK